MNIELYENPNPLDKLIKIYDQMSVIINNTTVIDSDTAHIVIITPTD